MKKPKTWLLWLLIFGIGGTLALWELKQTEAVNKHFEGAIWQK